ncbi:MAG: regulatory protein RecX [Methanosarcinaceae archaeon]
MEQENIENQAMKFAMKLLSIRKRSIFEITTRLKKKEFAEDIINLVLKNLNEYKYLNDEEFAEAYINDRINFNPRGNFLIKKELREKGIAEDIIAEKIEKLLPLEKEMAMAKEATEKKLKYLNKDIDKNKIYQKLGAHLQSKGYSSDIIRDILENMLFKK